MSKYQNTEQNQEATYTKSPVVHGYHALTNLYPVLRKLVNSGVTPQELPSAVMGVSTKTMPRQTFKNKMFEEMPSGMAPLLDPRLEAKLQQELAEKNAPTFSSKLKIKPTPR